MITSIAIEKDFLFANPLPGGNGWTFTLASRLGNMLRIAKELYGPRDLNYTILGVEFGGETPQLWYPGNCGHIVVQITPSCATDVLRAHFQLAHEVIHLLSPSGQSNTNVLEEGLATHFSVRYLREHLGIDATWFIELESYRSARALVEDLLGFDTDIIKKIRQHQSSIFLITAEDIQEACPEVPDNLAVALIQSFQR